MQTITDIRPLVLVTLTGTLLLHGPELPTDAVEGPGVFEHKRSRH